MKTLKLFLIGLLVVISISACNKDIPKNIPDWLKELIKEKKKEYRKVGYGEAAIYIMEISNDTTTLYKYYTGGKIANSGGNYHLYSEDGRLICSSFELSDCDETYTYENLRYNFHEVRLIWRPKR